jgi:hypothetical protein
MKLSTVIKLALAGSALIGGAAQAATITNTPTTAGGSDLVLFVKDNTTPAFFTQDLGNQIGSIYSKSQVTADGVLSSPKQISTPTSIAGTDAALASFLSAHSGDSFTWSILASDHTLTNTALGSQTALFTSTLDLSGVNYVVTNSNVGTFSTKTPRRRPRASMHRRAGCPRAWAMARLLEPRRRCTSLARTAPAVPAVRTSTSAEPSTSTRTARSR